MRVLLDTHIALWAITDDARLPTRARQMIEAPENQVAVSTASVWEIAIKHAIGRDRMPVPAAEAVAFFRASGFLIVNITPEHAMHAGALPPIHADPFDRLIVAQALTEPFRLVTRDAAVARYSDTIVLI